MARYFLFFAPILILFLGIYIFSQNVDITQVRNSEYMRGIEDKWQNTTEFVKYSVSEIKKLVNGFA